ncbi:MAG: 1-acyl-sn-glycerol-3-phosphate acyltransferase [Myxococcales bacterium]|nr:1-acyl-sn-glycerol-3-phosphate acyltransferase [Myxococcales bacterium]
MNTATPRETGSKARLPLPSVLARGVAACVAIAPASLAYMAVCSAMLPFRYARIRAGNTYGKIVGSTVFGLAGVKPVIDGLDKLQTLRPALYACNHASTADMWIGMWLCPKGGCGVAKKEIVRLPFFGQAYLLSGHLLIDRGNRKRAIRSMEKVREVVGKHKLSLWMWPEGTRSADGRLQPMKKGFVHMAIATGLPVVPVVFHDADLLWPKNALHITPGELRIEVLDPIDTSAWRAETAGEHAQQLWQVFQDALGPRQKGNPASS